MKAKKIRGRGNVDMYPRTRAFTCKEQRARTWPVHKHCVRKEEVELENSDGDRFNGAMRAMARTGVFIQV